VEGQAPVRQGGYEMREIVSAILYQSRTGCQWECLPRDLPPRSATYYYSARWRDAGTDQAIHDLLRWQAREKKGRRVDPTLAVLDTQSVHSAASVPAEMTGRDAGEKVPGRKRCLAVDVLGLVIAVVVLAASAHENTAGIALLDQVAASTPTVSTGAGRPGVQELGRRARRHCGHRRAGRRAQPG
jgi:transposase